MNVVTGSLGLPSPILLIRHIFHPVGCLAVPRFLDGNVGHGGLGGGTVPVFFARREPDDVAGEDFPDFTAKGLGKGSASLALTLIASHIVGRWGFDGNVGITANRDRDPPFDDGRHLIVWRISGALAYTLTPRWTLVADTGIARNAEKAGKTNPAFILAGAIYTPRSNVDIDIGIKAGLTSVEVHRQAGAGLTVRF